MSKTEKLKEVAWSILFIIVFLALFSAVTLVFFPKWNAGEESNASNGIYLEEDNSIDVLLLGSCNMYTSFSPVLFYENTGITSFDRTCPDQLMSTSYYYLEDAFKTQSPNVVVIDSLFLTEENTKSREFFDREALEYMPLSSSKLSLIDELSDIDYDFRTEKNESGPDRLLTKAGYIFPLLRYHSRDDISLGDFTFFFNYDAYNYNKGSVPFYNYTNMDGVKFDRVNNETTIRHDAQVFVPRIIELCKKNNAELLFINTPNNYRWDEETTAVAKEYIETLGADFIDLKSLYDNFDEYDYQLNTGRFNIYGMKKFTDLFGDFLVDTYELSAKNLSEENSNLWQKCVDRLYSESRSNGCDIYPGHIAQIKNEDDSIMLRWNSRTDCSKYKIYRKSDSEDKYHLLDSTEDNIYYDSNVISGNHYTYYVTSVMNNGSKIKSDVADYVFVKAPENFTATEADGNIILSWAKSKKCSEYTVQKRRYGAFKFDDFVQTTGMEITDGGIESTGTYFYRLLGSVEYDGNIYYSDSVICKIRIK